MATDTDTLVLLKAVQRNLPLSSLQNKGFLFIQIATILDHCLKSDLIRYSKDGKIEITALGQKFLHERDQQGNHGTSGWIEPLEEEKISQLAIDDIYIPTRHMVRVLKRGR